MQKNKQVHRILVIFTLLFVGIGSLKIPEVPVEAASVGSAKKVYVVFAEQTLKQFPRDDSRPTDAKEVHLSSGAEVEYLANAGSAYFKVRVDGVEGYIKRNSVTSPANYEKLAQGEKFEISDVAIHSEGQMQNEYFAVADAVIRTRDVGNACPVRLLKRGDQVRYLGSTNNRYFKVEVAGQEGYVFRGDLTADLNNATTQFTKVPVKQENLTQLQAVVNTNIRTHANVESAPVVDLKKDETIDYLGTVQSDNRWFMVRNETGIRGYVQRGDLTAGTARIVYEEEEEREVIPYETHYREDPLLAAGQERVKIAGEPGAVIRTYRLKYQDGELIERVLKSEKHEAAVDEVIIQGTAMKPAEFEQSLIDGDLFNQEFLALVNEERARVGVRPLKHQASLQKGIEKRLDENCEAYDICHTRPNGDRFSSAFCYVYDRPERFLGENLAYRSINRGIEADVHAGKTTFERGYAELFFEMYTESPSHYQNMIDVRYETMSVGMRKEQRRMFNVMIFSR